MKPFFGDDVLLGSQSARSLYENFAKDQPIIDYHCHLNPKEIAENKQFTDIGELWLAADHYKWRAMRQNGVDEAFITGNASFEEKFEKFAQTIAYAPGNPLYYWAHMELKQLFEINRPLNGNTAASIYKEANEKIASGGFSAQDLIRRCRVQVICTTDDPADDLAYHKRMQNLFVKVLPTFRPDIICFGLNRDDILPYLERLGKSADREITSFPVLLEVLEKRLDYFVSLGCRVADHALNTLPPETGTFEDSARAFDKARSGQKVEKELLDKYTDFMTRFFAVRYASRDMVMQLHMSPLRNVNSRLFARVGADSGIDIVGDPVSAADLARIFDTIQQEGDLPKTVVYCLNGTVNDMLSSLLGAFAGDTPGKMQLGSAWWFNDHADGIRAQLHALADAGLLGRFIGMLTDSRSFTSYVRFDFFRRILCDVVGAWVENGEFDPRCGDLIRAVCYQNAKDYFGF